MSYLDLLKKNFGEMVTLGADKTDKRASVGSVGADVGDFSENSEVMVRYRANGGESTIRVPSANVIDFERQARKRGLIRFHLLDNNGIPVSGLWSLECPRPGETRDECIRRLRAEFPSRLVLEGEE